MRILALLAGLLLVSTAARAEPPNTPHRVFFTAGESYAFRSLCPPRGTVDFEVSGPGITAGEESSNCTLNRTGWTFTAPVTGYYIAKVVTSVWIADTKFVIEPDCAEGSATTCGVRADIINPIVGKFTYPGDQDWIRLANNAYWNLKITPKASRPDCFVTARVVDAATARPIPTTSTHGSRYVVLTGGPSGCGYTATVGFRGF